VRVIAATNRVLVESVAAKTFREDLYYRLNVIHLQVPPLRNRKDDVPLLLRHFLEAFARQYQSPVPIVSKDALDVLMEHPWPGNVRELKNVVERLVIRGSNGEIGRDDLPLDVVRAVAAPSAQAPRNAPRPVADVLYDQMVKEGQSFWSVVYAPFMSRDLTRADLRSLVRMGLEHTTGNYKILVELFNMKPDDYKRFLAFLSTHDCRLPFHLYRGLPADHPRGSDEPRRRRGSAQPREMAHAGGVLA